MPREVAKGLIKEFKTNCPFTIAEKKGIVVIFEALGSALGFYNSYNRFKMIHINNQIDRDLQRFVCAHELGHAIMHPDANTQFLKQNTYIITDRFEKEANTFAVELLLPDEVIYEYRDTNLTIYDAANIYGIPSDLVKLKSVNRDFFTHD